MTNRRLELIAVSGIPQVTTGDDLGNIIADSIAAANLKLIDGDVLVVAQKIVSKAEGRTVRLGDIKASDAAIAATRQNLSSFTSVMRAPPFGQERDVHTIQQSPP